MKYRQNRNCIEIPITIRIDNDIFAESASEILSEQTLDPDYLGVTWESLVDRLATDPLWQSLVTGQLISDLRNYQEVDWTEWLTYDDLQTELETDQPSWHWLQELIHRSEQHQAALDHQAELQREAELVDQKRQLDIINQHMIEQLTSQGYVVYQKPRRRKKK